MAGIQPYLFEPIAEEELQDNQPVDFCSSEEESSGESGEGDNVTAAAESQ